MNRLLKWLLPIVVVVVGGYFVLVAVTGSQVRDVLERQLATYSEQNPEFDIEIEWTQTGFWRSQGNLYVHHQQLDEDELSFRHSLTLRHGALRADVRGELDGQLQQQSLSDMLFEGEKIAVDGRVGLGGAHLTYRVPALYFAQGEGDTHWQAEPFDLHLVLTEEEQHSQISIGSIRLVPDAQFDSEGFVIENLKATSQARLDPADNHISMGYMEWSVDNIVMDLGVLTRIEGFHNRHDFNRENDLLDMDMVLAVEQMRVDQMSGHGELTMRLLSLPYDAFIAFGEQADEEGAGIELMQQMHAQNARIMVDKLDVEAEGWGHLLAAGEFTIREDLPDTASASTGLVDFVDGHLELKEVPVMVQMMLAELISGDLPWHLELRDGSLIINGEPLQLPAQ